MAYEDLSSASVESRLKGLMAQQNPLMRQARTQGLQSANRRGLLNSSMGVQAAQTAQLGAALPIASQEAQQANARIMQGREFEHLRGMQGRQYKHEAAQLGRELGSREKLAQMDVAARERQVAANMAAEFDRTYSQQLATIMNNEKIPASVRQQYFTHAAEVRNSNLRLVEQLYGIDLDWTTPFEPDYPTGGTGKGGGKGRGTTTQQVMQRQARQIEEQQKREEERQNWLPYGWSSSGISPAAYNF